MPERSSRLVGLLAVISMLTLACSLQAVALKRPAPKRARAVSLAPITKGAILSAVTAANPVLAGEYARSVHQGEPPVAGKGMWIWQFGQIAAGNPSVIVDAALKAGINHIFVRAGSGRSGLDTLGQVRGIIPVAHAAGIKVIAWYFPYFKNVPADIRRCVTIINTTVAGETFDGLALDIEATPGSDLSAKTAWDFSRGLRAAAPNAYLVLVPPRPTKTTIRNFPYGATAPWYDAIAPMVYWGRFDPADTVRTAIQYLSRYGKPVAPIGQTYDMGPEGGPSGNPPAYETWAFMRAAKVFGAPGVSFWSWQEASSPEFDAIRHFDW